MRTGTLIRKRSPLRTEVHAGRCSNEEARYNVFPLPLYHRKWDGEPALYVRYVGSEENAVIKPVAATAKATPGANGDNKNKQK